MSKELHDKIRGMARRVTVKDIKDDGETQTASIEVADGVWRTDVEILQQYGISSSAPEDGAVGIALALGGDEGDMVLLPIANPSNRMGGLGKGDVGFYTKGGDRVIGRASGGIEIAAASSISLTVGGVSLTIDSAGFHFSGGGVWHDGVPIDKTHTHGGVVEGGGFTAPPAG
jgi:phage gp45-like